MFLFVYEILIFFYPVLHNILGKKQLHVNTFSGDRFKGLWLSILAISSFISATGV